MRKVLKWVGIVLASLGGLLLAAVLGIYIMAELKLTRTYDIPPSGIAVPTGAEAVARGRHLTVVIFQCGTCHGEDLSGQVLFDDFLTGRLAPSNLTPGEGGAGTRYTDEDWVRAIRHGVLANRRAGVAMVSNIYNIMSDDDVGAMVAYLKSLPPVDKVVPPTELRLMGRLFLLVQESEVLPAAGMDHTAARPPAPAPGVTVEYGAYLAHVCTFCHGANYAGFASEDGDPDAGFAANLTPAGNLARWTEADFVNTLRTGVTPEGDVLDPEGMPWKLFGQMTDDELAAIWLYLQTLPPAEPSVPGLLGP